jgi:DNA-directed RNA polymerase subunit M/transcription elongation factor TFIIS
MSIVKPKITKVNPEIIKVNPEIIKIKPEIIKIKPEIIKIKPEVDIETPDESPFEYPNTIPLNIKFYENENYNNNRRLKLLLFGECLGKTDKSVDDKECIIKYLERGCLNRAIESAKIYNIRCIWSNEKFVNLYHSICYKIAVNIDTNSCIKSDYILNKILNDDVDPLKIANMSSKDLCPKKYEKIEEKMQKRNNLERKIKFSEMYTCRKCKRKQTTTERCYNRSLDEGVNLTIRCLFCGNSWGG